MYNIIRLHQGSLKKNLTFLATARCCYSHQILLPKSMLTRVLCHSRNILSLEGSKKYFSTLRSNVRTYNERSTGKRKLHNLASKEGFKSSPLDVNTAVLNNVMLYKYEKPKFFTFVNLFAPLQCIFWMWVSYYVYTKLPECETPSIQYLKENWPWIMISGSALWLGTTSMALIWIFTSRSIKYIILKAGGQDLTFLTYHPLKGNVGITVPISHVSSRVPRKEMVNYLSIKLRGRSWYYILDSGGEFVNPKLYDHTVGIVRF